MSTASSTTAAGWYADPSDGSLLRWWTGTSWSEQTVPAASVQAPAAASPAAAPPVLSAVPPLEQPYVPPNSVFRIAETGAGEAYSPEWSALTDIAEDVALNGVPVQLALTSASSEPPIPVSVDAFPMLKPESPAASVDKEPAWQVEVPLAGPVDQLFPVNGPAAVSAELLGGAAPSPAPVPPPAGQLFPGLVPNAEPSEVPIAPVAPPDFPPFAASTPGTSYVPLAPRPIPQPAVLGIPAPTTDDDTLAASTVPASWGAVTPPLPPVPTEYWPTQGTPPPSAVQPGAMPPSAAQPGAVQPGQMQPSPVQPGQMQPSPGSYVPFDPNAVHLQPVPMIPFSSRDPFNPASTARPGMRTYAAAPVGPSGSTWTGGVVFMLIAPLLEVGAYFVWTRLVTMAVLPSSSITFLSVAVFAIALFAIAAAQFDRNGLAKRGYFDLASPFWVLLGPLIYLIVRATRLHRQGRGAPAAIVLWVLSTAGSAALIAFAVLGTAASR